MKIFSRTIAVGLLVIAPPVIANDFDQNHTEFVNSISINPLTADAVWLEMLNAFEEWEKVILVFGFAGRGDWAQCERIRSLVVGSSPQTEYRCNPVN